MALGMPPAALSAATSKDNIIAIPFRSISTLLLRLLSVFSFHRFLPLLLLHARRNVRRTVERDAVLPIVGRVSHYLSALTSSSLLSCSLYSRSIPPTIPGRRNHSDRNISYGDGGRIDAADAQRDPLGASDRRNERRRSLSSGCETTSSQWRHLMTQ